ncbi:MAG TPA: permease, partial [Burkholderiales bacterium]|nr:permease [Burkholderiales bacterium]
THLLVLGFITMTMSGALMQMLPVLAGSPVPRPRMTAWAVHLPLSAGALLLPAAFLTGHRPLLLAAVALLAGALGLVVLVVVGCLTRAPARSATVRGMRHAAAGLAIATTLGALLALRRAGIDLLPGAGLSPLHVAWGLMGWILLLVIGIAYQVVPMFQLTPPYPEGLSRWLTPALLAGLAAWSWAALHDTAPTPLLATVLSAGCALFGAATLRLQARRRRGRRDFTVWFWRIAVACLIAACILWGTQPLLPGGLSGQSAPMIGALVLGGAALSVISGMLYKIAPFLAWFHLQSLAAGRWRIPNMREALPEARIRLQFGWHLATLAALAAGFAMPEPFARVAGAALAISGGLLARNLAGTARLYRETRVKLEALRRLGNL